MTRLYWARYGLAFAVVAAAMLLAWWSFSEDL